MSFQYRNERGETQRPLLSSLVHAITGIADTHPRHELLLRRCHHRLRHHRFQDTRAADVSHGMSSWIERFIVHNQLYEASQLNDAYQHYQSVAIRPSISDSDSEAPYRIIAFLLSLAQSKPITASDDDDYADSGLLPRIIRIDGMAASESNSGSDSHSDSDDWEAELNRSTSSSDDDDYIANADNHSNSPVIHPALAFSSRRGSLRSSVIAIIESTHTQPDSEFLQSLDQILPSLALTHRRTHTDSDSDSGSDGSSGTRSLSQLLYEHEQHRRRLRSLPLSLPLLSFSQHSLLAHCLNLCHRRPDNRLFAYDTRRQCYARMMSVSVTSLSTRCVSGVLDTVLTHANNLSLLVRMIGKFRASSNRCYQCLHASVAQWLEGHDQALYHYQSRTLSSRSTLLDFLVWLIPLTRVTDMLVSLIGECNDIGSDNGTGRLLSLLYERWFELNMLNDRLLAPVVLACFIEVLAPYLECLDQWTSSGTVDADLSSEFFIVTRDGTTEPSNDTSSDTNSVLNAPVIDWARLPTFLRPVASSILTTGVNSALVTSIQNQQTVATVNDEETLLSSIRAAILQQWKQVTIPSQPQPQLRKLDSELATSTDHERTVSTSEHSAKDHSPVSTQSVSQLTSTVSPAAAFLPSYIDCVNDSAERMSSFIFTPVKVTAVQLVDLPSFDDCFRHSLPTFQSLELSKQCQPLSLIQALCARRMSSNNESASAIKLVSQSYIHPTIERWGQDYQSTNAITVTTTSDDHQQQQQVGESESLAVLAQKLSLASSVPLTSLIETGLFHPLRHRYQRSKQRLVQCLLTDVQLVEHATALQDLYLSHDTAMFRAIFQPVFDFLLASARAASNPNHLESQSLSMQSILSDVLQRTDRDSELNERCRMLLSAHLRVTVNHGKLVELIAQPLLSSLSLAMIEITEIQCDYHWPLRAVVTDEILDSLNQIAHFLRQCHFATHTLQSFHCHSYRQRNSSVDQSLVHEFFVMLHRIHHCVNTLHRHLLYKLSAVKFSLHTDTGVESLEDVTALYRQYVERALVVSLTHRKFRSLQATIKRVLQLALDCREVAVLVLDELLPLTSTGTHKHTDDNDDDAARKHRDQLVEFDQRRSRIEQRARLKLNTIKKEFQQNVGLLLKLVEKFANQATGDAAVKASMAELLIAMDFNRYYARSTTSVTSMV